MIRKIVFILAFSALLNVGHANAGATGSEELKTVSGNATANECFDGFSRAMFSFNHALDKTVFKPVAKGYRALPVPIRKGTGIVVNTTVGVLGIFDPASSFGLEKNGKEDFGQTMGVWGADSGCYFVLPILGPTTTRDAIGLVGNVFLDPVYQITHDTEISNGVIGNGNYSEHNYYYYRATGSVDFRAKNIESFDSVEKNSIDLYASMKSLYLQDRIKKILNTQSAVETQDDSDWEEIDTN